MVRCLYILTGHLKNNTRIRNVDKDAGSEDKGRTHLSINVELALCLQLAQPMAIEKSLQIASYNCRGWTSGSRYANDLLPECDILCLQEHRLLQELLHSLSTVKEFDFPIYSCIRGSITVWPTFWWVCYSIYHFHQLS